jgi:protein gp37
MQATTIQWCDDTVNPTMGCEGCELWSAARKICYAGKLTKRFGGGWRKNKLPQEQRQDFSVISFHPGKIAEAAKWSDLTGTVRHPIQTGTDKNGDPKITPAKPWLNGLPRLIFVSDMSDALSAVVPFEYLRAEVVQQVTSPNGMRHCWLWLTKRPDRMAEFSAWLAKQGIEWPVNLWTGTSITTQATLKRARQLLDVGDGRTIRFLSIEPQWQAITLGELLPSLNWVIQGGESGNPATLFAMEWADELRTECEAAGVPYFLKQLGSHVTQNGERVAFENWEGGDWLEWPARFRVRQMPKHVAVGGSPATTNSTSWVPTIASAAESSQAEKRSQAARKAWATRKANAKIKATAQTDEQKFERAWAYAFGAGL